MFYWDEMSVGNCAISVVVPRVVLPIRPKKKLGEKKRESKCTQLRATGSCLSTACFILLTAVQCPPHLLVLCCFSFHRAPEMVDLWRRRVVGLKADVWALGCILYSLAFLKHPFQDGSSLGIANSKVKIPRQTGYSKGFTKLLGKMFKIE